MSELPKSGPESVKSSARTLDILEALAERRLSLTELAQRLAIPKSSLHAVLKTMLTRGWVRADATGTRFALGLRALAVGAAYVDSDDVVAMLAPALDDLAQRFGETVHLGRLDGSDVVYLAKRESAHPLRLFSAIGRRLPAHSTALGKALLAARDDTAIPRSLAKLTPRTIASPAALRAELAEVRGRGYAVDREENATGIMCFAIALPTASPPVDAISVSVPASRLSPALEKKITTALLAHRRRPPG